MKQTAHKTLVSDFDGTMTKHDFFRLALSYSQQNPGPAMKVA